MTTTSQHRTIRTRLLAAVAAVLLGLGLAACDTGTGVEGGGVSPADDPGADTGATGEGFDDLEDDTGTDG
jgi:hypothetical protein